MATIAETLKALFDAERTARAHHASLRGEKDSELLPALRAEIKGALALDDEAEASVRLVRISFLLGDLEGSEVVDLLVDVLGSTTPEARIAAGEALEALAFDRFKEVALGIERALERLPAGSPALTELPFLLAEVGEPGCAKLLGRFLQNDDAEVVASAIEAMAELGDPAAIPMLAKLERDGRQVQLDDEDGGGERVSIADLAHEAKEILEEISAESAPARGAAAPGGQTVGAAAAKRSPVRSGTLPDIPPPAAAAHRLSAEEAAVFETAVVPRYLSFFGERLLALTAAASDARVCHLYCRTGYPDQALLERLPNAHVYGADASESAVELARAKASAIVQANESAGVVFDYQVAEALPLAFPDGAFSHAFSIHPLAPPPERAAIVDELARILAPAGQALLALPLRGSFVEVADLLREYAVKYESSELLNALDAAALHRPTEEMLARELEDAGFEYVEVDSSSRALRFESGRDFLEDPLTRLLLLPDLRLGLPLETQPQAVDPFAYVREAIDKYWSDGTFELTVHVGVASGRRKG